MSSITNPRMYAAKAGGAIVANAFVKDGSNDGEVVQAGAGDVSMGIAQGAAASGEPVEVARQGGGAKLQLGGTVTRGQFLKSDASGYGVAATADKEAYGAKAGASGVSGDVIPVEVMQGYLSV